MKVKEIKRYPLVQCVMHPKKHTLFVKRCKKDKIGMSTVLNKLSDMWLDRAIELDN